MQVPSFVIVGERRCGTTSLSHLMAAHPDVHVHDKRELGYFIEDEARYGNKRRAAAPVAADPEHWERTHSADTYAGFFDAPTGAKAVGEKSADYFFWRPAHERIARFLPEAKFVVTLRDPVSRAWSHYWNEVGKGRERLSFEEAIVEEEERCRRSVYAQNHLSYIRRGFYDETLEHFLTFVPKERVHVMTLEEVKQDRDDAMRRLLGFIGVTPDKWTPPRDPMKNENWAMVLKPWARGLPVEPLEAVYDAGVRLLSKGLASEKFKRRAFLQSFHRVFREPVTQLPMPNETRARLRETYRPHIARLEEIAGRKFEEWDWR